MFTLQGISITFRMRNTSKIGAPQSDTLAALSRPNQQIPDFATWYPSPLGVSYRVRVNMPETSCV